MVVRQLRKGVSVNSVAQPMGRYVQRVQALEDRAAIRVGQGAQRAEPLACHAAIVHHGQVLAGRAEVADHPPQGVSRSVDRDLAQRLGRFAALS